MDQNTNTGIPAMSTADNEKQKSGNGLKIITAIACVVAVCGIGFGVYGMMQSMKKNNQIADLKVQIKEEDGTVTTVEAPEIKTTSSDGTTVTITDTANTNEKTDEYIYIGEWGLKLKLPKGLHEVSYKIQNTHENEGPWYSGAGTSMLYIEGWNSAKDAITYSSESSTSGSCNSAAVVRSPKGQVSGTSPAFTIGDYDFHFLGWQAPCSTPEETQTGTLLRDVILNPDNYSSI